MASSAGVAALTAWDVEGSLLGGSSLPQPCPPRILYYSCGRQATSAEGVKKFGQVEKFEQTEKFRTAAKVSNGRKFSDGFRHIRKPLEKKASL